MNWVTRVPITDIILAVVVIGFILWILYRGFNCGSGSSGDSAKEKPKSTKSKPSAPGININIGGSNVEDTDKSK